MSQDREEATEASRVNELVAAMEKNRVEMHELRIEENHLRSRITAKTNERSELQKAFTDAIGQLGRHLGMKIEVSEQR